MYVLRHIAAIAALVLPLSMASAAVAQPAPISSSITKATTPLSRADKAQIATFVEYWCRQLGDANSGGEMIRRARLKLYEPVRASIVITPIFREGYSEAIIPPLLTVLQSDSPSVRINALQVFGQLGTTDAADELVNLCSLEDEARTDVRIWASRGLARCIAEGDLPANKITIVLRELGAAAGRETEPLALRRQFEAIASIGGDEGRRTLVKAFGDAAKRILANEPEATRLMPSMHRAAKLLLEQYLRLDSATKTRLGTQLAPALGLVVEIGEMHFDTRVSSAARRDYGETIGNCETVLKQIDSQIRGGAPPATSLKKSWDDRNKGDYQRGASEWKSVLSGPPYGP